MELVTKGDTSSHRSYISSLGTIFLKGLTNRVFRLSVTRLKDFYCNYLIYNCLEQLLNIRRIRKKFKLFTEKDMKYDSATIRLGFQELLTLPSGFSSPLVTVYSLLPLSLWNSLLWLAFFSVPSTVTVDFPPDTAGNLIQHPACSWYKKLKQLILL